MTLCLDNQDIEREEKSADRGEVGGAQFLAAAENASVTLGPRGFDGRSCTLLR